MIQDLANLTSSLLSTMTGLFFPRTAFRVCILRRSFLLFTHSCACSKMKLLYLFFLFFLLYSKTSSFSLSKKCRNHGKLKGRNPRVSGIGWMINLISLYRNIGTSTQCSYRDIAFKGVYCTLYSVIATLSLICCEHFNMLMTNFVNMLITMC